MTLPRCPLCGGVVKIEPRSTFVPPRLFCTMPPCVYSLISNDENSTARTKLVAAHERICLAVGAAEALAASMQGERVAEGDDFALPSSVDLVVGRPVQVVPSTFESLLTYPTDER